MDKQTDVPQDRLESPRACADCSFTCALFIRETSLRAYLCSMVGEWPTHRLVLEQLIGTARIYEALPVFQAFYSYEVVLFSQESCGASYSYPYFIGKKIQTQRGSMTFPKFPRVWLYYYTRPSHGVVWGPPGTPELVWMVPKFKINFGDKTMFALLLPFSQECSEEISKGHVLMKPHPTARGI